MSLIKIAAVFILGFGTVFGAIKSQRIILCAYEYDSNLWKAIGSEEYKVPEVATAINLKRAPRSQSEAVMCSTLKPLKNHFEFTFRQIYYSDNKFFKSETCSEPQVGRVVSEEIYSLKPGQSMWFTYPSKFDTDMKYLVHVVDETNTNPKDKICLNLGNHTGPEEKK